MSATRPRSSANRKVFDAVLEPLEMGLAWVVVRIPFDLAATWPVRNGKCVRGLLAGVEFSTSLFHEKQTGRHFLLVNKKLRAAAKVSVGEKVRVEMEPDFEAETVAIPPELARALREDRRLRPWFDKLSAAMRKWIVAMVTEAKSADARRNRAERTAEWLLLVIEGEAETPPILRAAFLRHPGARAGWQAMSPARRRKHLLGIFYIRGAEARERRVDKAMEDAVLLADRVAEKVADGAGEKRPAGGALTV